MRWKWPMCLKYVSRNLPGLDHAVAEPFRLPSDSHGIGSHHVLWEAWVSGFLLHAHWKLQRCSCLWQEGSTPCLWSCSTLFPFILAASPLDQGQRVIQGGLRSEAREFVWVVGGLLGLPPRPVVVESGSLGHPPNSTAHRFCAGYKLQKLDPSCGLQITLSCILSRPWELEKTVHEGNTISSWGRKQKS